MKAKGYRLIAALGSCAVTATSALAQDRDSQPLNPPQPNYPYLASLFHVEGNCDVRFSVDEEGLPFGLMTSCTHPIFCHEAERAVSRVKFLPKLVDGIPTVRTDIIYPLIFQLQSYNPETGEWENHKHGDQETYHENIGPSAPCKEIPVS